MQSKNKIEAILRVDKVTQSIVVTKNPNSNLKRNLSSLIYNSTAAPRPSQRPVVINLAKTIEKTENNELDKKYVKTTDSSFITSTKLNNSKGNEQRKLSIHPKTERQNEIADLKRIQRNQIYALNELMTKLEYQNFIEFCKKNDLAYETDMEI